jgi:hypothetical protein
MMSRLKVPGEIRADLRCAQFLLGYLQVRRSRDDICLAYRRLRGAGEMNFAPTNMVISPRVATPLYMHSSTKSSLKSCAGFLACVY